MEAKHLSGGATMTNKLLVLCLFLISVIAGSGTSIKVSSDSRSKALPTSKRFSSSHRQLLDKKVNSTRNETGHLDSSLIGETSPTTPTTIPMTTSPTTPFTSPTLTPVTPATPTLTPTTPTIPVTTPVSPTTPITTPVSPTTPITTPVSPTTPTTPTTGSSGTWCVAKSGVSDTSLQVALDYACGLGGADCTAIQQGGACYNPDTVAAHASYAFDNYYKKSGMTSGSCDFGGNAVVTTQDPSTGTCTFPTSSSGSTVLNTSNPTGGFGGIAPANSSDSASILLCLPMFFTLIFLALSIILGDRL